MSKIAFTDVIRHPYRLLLFATMPGNSCEALQLCCYSNYSTVGYRVCSIFYTEIIRISFYKHHTHEKENDFPDLTDEPSRMGPAQYRC